MRVRVNRVSVMVAAVIAASAISLSAPTAAVADPVGATGSTIQALPPFETWISDVTAVTDQAKAYLETRLPATTKAAIVLDIDNTALEATYKPGLTNPATAPVLALAKQAKAGNADVIFITRRPEFLRLLTDYNLHNVGYPVDGLYMRAWLDFGPDDVAKTNARIAVEAKGYTIVANIGNNNTDLVGGHAERTFKLPDYNGQLP